MKVWWVGVVLVAWGCMWTNSIIASPPTTAVATAIENNHHHFITFKGYTVKFTTKGATRNSYFMFMKDLFNALTDHADRSGFIPVLPQEWRLLPTCSQYVFVDLSNGEQTITVALNASNAYVLGYLAQDRRSYFFRDAAVTVEVQNIIFPNTEHHELPFGVSYQSLEGAAGVRSRAEVPLGINDLSTAITSLYYGRPDESGSPSAPVARALLVTIQMVAEAVRLRTIQEEILNTIWGAGSYGEFHPTALHLSLENRWGRLSTAVQSAAQDGVFSRPVSLDLGQGVPPQVYYNVREVLFLLALMPFMCRAHNPGLQLSSSSSWLSRLALELDRLHRRHDLGGDDDDSCNAIADPTVHLLGQDGLCVDVYQGNYSNGNKIILYPCGGQDQVNQLWTMRSDKTIRSNGKCLAASEFASRDYVMIYDCDAAVVDATKWEFLWDGTIMNPRSSLVLTALKDASSGTTNLVVDLYNKASRQAWTATNVTKPLATKIAAGYNNLCLQTSGSGGGVEVRLDSCETNSNTDEWLVYPDGTIRPYADNKSCLQYKKGRPVLFTGSCEGSIEEFWLFQSDGTILHAWFDKVIVVKDTSAPVLQLTLDDPNPDRLSQYWFQFRI